MKLSDKFEELRQKKEKALITYVTGGDPDYETSKQLLKTHAASGADIIEIGIPFSDPVADGPVVQKASERALVKGFSVRDGLRLVKEVRDEGIKIPLLFMSYYNPIYVYGLESFVRDAKKAGLSGIIIPDLPPEEAEEFLKFTREYSFDVIFLLAPTMTEERLAKVTEKASGFIYFVSVAGVTGVRTTVNEKLPLLVKRVKEVTNIPVGVGFGISSPEQVKEVCGFADAVIVASAIIRIIEANLADKEKMITDVASFVKELKKGTV